MSDNDLKIDSPETFDMAFRISNTVSFATSDPGDEPGRLADMEPKSEVMLSFMLKRHIYNVDVSNLVGKLA